MPIRIAFVNGKGGVGKTTCSTLVAAVFKESGQSVSIDDRDPQRSATTAAGIFGLSLGSEGDTVIIDTAPTLQMESTIEAVHIADLVVLVTTPSPLDLATTAATAQRILAERPSGRVRILFNLVQTNNRFFEEMPEIAKEIPFPALKNFLVRRTAYQVAQLAGWKSIPSTMREDVIRVTLEIVAALPKPSV